MAGPGFGGMGFSGGARHSGRGETEKPKGYDKKIIKRLIKYAVPYWHLFLIALIFISLVSLIEIVRPYIIKIVIDDNIYKAVEGLISIEEARKGILMLSLVFLGLMLLEFIIRYIQTYLLQSTGKKIIMRIRRQLFSHIQKLPVSYFDKNPVGRIVTRVTNDTEALNEMYTIVVVGVIQIFVLMVGIVIVLFSFSVKLILISFLVIPLMVFVTVLFRTRARKVFTEIRRKLAIINAYISENISGIKIVQVFNMQQKKIKDFEKINRDYYQSTFKQISLFGIFRPFMDIVRSLALALLIWFGGRDILQGTLEFGTVFAFINYINLFFQPIMELTEQYNTLQSSIVASERIFGLLDMETEHRNKDELTDIRKAKGEIEFKNVWFAYNKDEWVLKDISFKIYPGQTVAFVGATGSGKTSIINLICGFYENQRGEILIDGVNIKDIKKKSLRTNIGLVLQDVFLFSGTIESNIRLFNENITFEQVKEAAEYVNAGCFIDKLPNGYKTKVNEKATTLSLGQRQLLSFARAIVTNPSILALDEATANIDTETEGNIQQAIEKVMRQRTCISVAHRLSTIQKSDNIIVIHKGEIREMGTHEELMAKKELYHSLSQLTEVAGG